MAIATMPDPALYGLEDRATGSACTTPCAADCTRTCHERCKHAGTRLHDDYYCDQIRLGRDVSEYRPDIRRNHEADLRAQRMRTGSGRIGAVLRRAPGGWDA
jgi:hypothetical protein